MKKANHELKGAFVKNYTLPAGVCVYQMACHDHNRKVGNLGYLSVPRMNKEAPKEIGASLCSNESVYTDRLGNSSLSNHQCVARSKKYQVDPVQGSSLSYIRLLVGRGGLPPILSNGYQ